MSSTLPDFVSDDAPATTADQAPETPVTETAPATEAAPAAEGQPRGPDGKFAPAKPAEPAPAPAEAAPQAAAPQPAPATPAPAPAPETPPPVPLATALEWRDRMTQAEKRAKELEEWRTQQEAQARRQPPPPSFAENPEAAAAHQVQQVQEALYEQRRDMSRRFAEVQHGKETVDAAFNWAAELIDRQLATQGGRSSLNDDIRRHPDPLAFVVDIYKRDQLASKWGEIATKADPGRFEAFLAWEAAQQAGAASAQGQPPAQPAAGAPAALTAPPAAPAAPRPSLAAAPAAASSSAPIPRDGAATYDAQFGT